MNLENQKQLKQRVVKAKKILKEKGIKRSQFIDYTYGKLYEKERNKLINLWDLKTTDLEFTLILETFVEHPDIDHGTKADFKNYMKFVNWNESLGGKITFEDFVNVFDKFKTNTKC